VSEEMSRRRALLLIYQSGNPLSCIHHASYWFGTEEELWTASAIVNWHIHSSSALDEGEAGSNDAAAELFSDLGRDKARSSAAAAELFSAIAVVN
jgi:hypothetical protein